MILGAISFAHVQETQMHARSYPITPAKGAAPLGGSNKDLTIFWKTKSSKRAHALFFVALIFLAIKQINDVKGGVVYCLKYHYSEFSITRISTGNRKPFEL